MQVRVDGWIVRAVEEEIAAVTSDEWFHGVTAIAANSHPLRIREGVVCGN